MLLSILQKQKRAVKKTKPKLKNENFLPNGAVLFAVYRKPNIYYHAARETAGF